MQTDQELFARGLATYRRVIAENYMAHQEVYRLLRRVLETEAPDEFVFLDLACGTAAGSADALKDTRIGRYIGIDISQPSLDVARQALTGLNCPVDLRCQDFVAAISTWTEPIDVVWIGQSLHHLATPLEKRDLMRRVQQLIPRRGFFMIWEPTCLDNEDRQGWLEHFRRLRAEWSILTDEEFAAFDVHCTASDYPETAATWISLGREAGFERCEELLVVPNGLARVYRYSH